MTLEIGNKTFNTPFTITPYETATKVILGTTLLVKARMGLAWAGNEVYLTFGHNNNKLIEAQLNETEAHTMVNVNEVVLLPKETKLIDVKFETWKGKVTNMRHKPALITTAPEFQDVGIAICLLYTSPSPRD